MATKQTIIISPSFEDVIGMIQQTRQQVLHLANKAMVDLYWRVGQYVSNKIATAEWGEGVVRQLADHIANCHPDIKGFSDKNIWRMKQFYETYASADEKLSPLVRELSWTNNMVLLSRTKTMEEKAFYMQLCIKEHLSKRELNRQIDSALYERSQLDVPKLSPVLRELVPESEQVFRDHYVMEFITGEESKPESSLRSALITRMKDFILELGKDFIYIDQDLYARQKDFAAEDARNCISCF